MVAESPRYILQCADVARPAAGAARHHGPKDLPLLPGVHRLALILLLLGTSAFKQNRADREGSSVVLAADGGPARPDRRKEVRNTTNADVRDVLQEALRRRMLHEHDRQTEAGRRGPVEERRSGSVAPPKPTHGHKHPSQSFVEDADPDDLDLADELGEVPVNEVIYALGGGTGATIGGTGSADLDRDLLRRMRYQDKAVMMLLLFMYFITLVFSANFAYRQALNDSPVRYYADPRFHDMVLEGNDVDRFLDTFNQSPKDMQLQVAGFIQVPSGMVSSVEWQGECYLDAFSFALDLSPWIVRENTTEGPPQLVDGFVAEDLETIHDWLVHDSNDLSIIELQKEVSWNNWEELATNIKHKIRQCGFAGIISVHRTECESVNVYKNTPWANFMHSRTTKVLCALSVVGWIFYLPYMYIRCNTTSARSHYRIDISINDYWGLISSKLSAEGFSDSSSAEGT